MADGQLIGTGHVLIKPKLDDGALSAVESKGGSAGLGFGSAFSVAAGNLIANAVQAIAGAAVDVFKQAFDNYANFEQLEGGVEKIFDQADIGQIMADANQAYKELNMSANEYLAAINQTGAAFASTMGDEKGYETARRGMMAISDYASGTGRNLDELNQKYALITRSTASYQSIADQFSGILPATSADFLAVAQAAGYLSDEYTSLTQVPIDEYQYAVTAMLEKGVDDMGLAGNTLAESTNTITGSLATLSSAWDNYLTGIFDDNADMGVLGEQLMESIGNVLGVVGPKIQGAVTRVLEGLPGAISDFLANIPAYLAPIIESVFGEELGGEINTFISETWESVTTTVTGAMDTISIIMEEAWPVIQEIIETAMTTIDGFMTDIWPSIQSVITTVMDTVSQIIQVAWPIIMNIMSTAMNTIQSIASVVWPIISTIVQTAMDVVTGAIEGIQPLVDFVGGVFEGIQKAIEDPMGSVKGIVEEAISFIEGIFEGAHLELPHIDLPHFIIEGGEAPWGIGGAGTPPKIDIEWYARGGIVDGPTLIGAGEAGPEMILPRQGGLMDEFASTVASKVSGISINGPVTVIADDPEDFIRQLTSFAARTRAQYA